MKAHAAGKHCILELYDCLPKDLDNEAYICDLVKDGAKVAGATLLSLTSHRFSPQGVTALGLLAESHLSIHTWPEFGYAAVDFFTCSDHCRPEKACEFLAQTLHAGKHELQIIIRGQSIDSKSAGPFTFFTRGEPETGAHHRPSP